MTKINYVFKDQATGKALLIRAGSRAEAKKAITHLGPGHDWEIIDSWIIQDNAA